jgi:hypothetical protein
MKTRPGGKESATLATVVNSPADEIILTGSPSPSPSCWASPGLISNQECGEKLLSREALRLLVPLPK